MIKGFTKSYLRADQHRINEKIHTDFDSGFHKIYYWKAYVHIGNNTEQDKDKKIRLTGCSSWALAANCFASYIDNDNDKSPLALMFHHPRGVK